MNHDEWEEWKEYYKGSIREWKQKAREALQEWKEQFRDWKAQARSEGSFPHLPPIPPIPPLHSTSPGRVNVVASRLGDEDLRLIDILIEAGVFGTRSEAVAYLVNEGIKARQDVLDKVSSSLRDIRDIRKKAEEEVKRLKEEIGLAESQAVDVEDKVESDVKDEVEATEERTCSTCDKDLSALPEDIAVCPYCGKSLGKKQHLAE